MILHISSNLFSNHLEKLLDIFSIQSNIIRVQPYRKKLLIVFSLKESPSTESLFPVKKLVSDTQANVVRRNTVRETSLFDDHLLMSLEKITNATFTTEVGIKLLYL